MNKHKRKDKHQKELARLDKIRKRKSKPALASKPVAVYSYHDGDWIKTDITNRQKIAIESSRNKLVYNASTYQRAEPEYKYETDYLDAIEQSIQKDCGISAVSDLPPKLREVVERFGEWCTLPGGKLLRIMDPVEQVYENNDWGSFTKDKEETEASIQPGYEHFLEGKYLIDDSTPQNEVFSILEEFLQELPEGEFTSTKVDKIRDKYKELISEEADKEKKELLQLQMEHEIDKETSFVTMTSSNPLVGMDGYSSPKSKLQFRPLEKEHPSTKAALDRIRFLSDLRAEAVDISKMSEYLRFTDKIRPHWKHDKILLKKWSMYDTENSKSAFTVAKEEAMEEWRKKYQCRDEEGLRKHIWNKFDKAACVLPPNGKNFPDLPIRVKDSWWKQQRTRAFQELFLTKSQWSQVYNIAKISKARIFGMRDPQWLAERDRVISLLSSNMQRVDNLRDLNDYKQWANKMKTYKSGEVFPSLIQRITIKDESLWRKMCNNWKHGLTNRLRNFIELNKQAESLKEEEIKIESFTATCPRKNCNVNGFDKPKFIRFKEDRGLIFVRCPECNKRIWYSEPAKTYAETFKTKEEFERLLNENITQHNS